MEASVVVGIDVYKDRLDVAIYPSDEPGFAVARHAAGLDALAERLKSLAPPLSPLRRPAASSAWWWPALLLPDCRCWWSTPAQIHAFANALGKRAKPAPINASVIRQRAGADWLRPVARARPAPPAIAALRGG